MVCGSLRVPCFIEAASPQAEAIPAVGVPDFKDRAGYAFAFRDQQAETTFLVFYDGKQRDRAVLHLHLHRKAVAHLAVIHAQRTYANAALRNANVSWTV